MTNQQLHESMLSNYLIEVAEYIVSCDSGEYESYLSYCTDNGYEPKNILGEFQSNHVYAKALIGLGLEFPCDDTDCTACASDMVSTVNQVDYSCDQCGHKYKV